MESLRSSMPALANKVYFNYGGQGPLPQESLKAITISWEKIQELGPFTNKLWPYVAGEIEATRRLLANMCGVNRDRVALTENVTSGCVLPLLGLPFKEGERILIGDCEHPGVVSACKELARQKRLFVDILPVQKLRYGVTEQNILNKVLLEDLNKGLKYNTKLVVLSHLLWNTGTIMPIQLVADVLNSHPGKPFLLVDAAQSFGQLPLIDIVSKADIYAFTGHKWACGPEGLGGVAISTRVLEESRPTLIGWKSLRHEGSIYQNNSHPFHADARRFEVATSCIPLLAGLRVSIDLLEREGSINERLRKIRSLSNKLWNDLQSIKGINTILEGPPPAGLVSFSLISNCSGNEIVNTLGKKNIWIRLLEDPTWLRACLHVTSESSEIVELIEAMKSL